MVERLLEKTTPAVQLAALGPQTKGEKTRERLLDVAYLSIIEKGFGATSIEELVEAAGITKSGFFYHFKDKGDLARQVLNRYIDEDERIFDALTERAVALSDDPLQSFLIFLNLYAQLMDDMEAIHPGCMVATVTYQERLFDRDICAMNRAFLLGLRARFAEWIGRVVAIRAPRIAVDVDELADQLTVIVEGAIILSKGLGQPALLGRQTRHYRNYVRLLFDA